MKIAIVTGASSGMGREFVIQISHLYEHLDEIWVIARRKDRLEELKQQVKVPLRILDGDLLCRPIYTEIIQLLKTKQPDIRMLVNAAGFGKSGSFLEIQNKEADAQPQMIDLNCRCLTEVTGICLPYMSKGSRIVNLASAAAFSPQTGFAVYAATKSYVLSFSQSLAEELSPKKIFVTAVCPGPVATEFFQVSGGMSNTAKAAFMAEPKQVVYRALMDSKEKRRVSVYGAPMQAARVGAKLVPHNLILKVMGRMDKKEKECK